MELCRCCLPRRKKTRANDEGADKKISGSATKETHDKAAIEQQSEYTNFWFLAYQKCCDGGQATKLMEEIRRHLGIGGGGNDEKWDNPTELEFRQMSESIKARLAQRITELDESKWKIPLRNGEVEVRELILKFAGVVALAKDFVGPALSSNPSAALAWSLVCAGLRSGMIFMRTVRRISDISELST